MPLDREGDDFLLPQVERGSCSERLPSMSTNASLLAQPKRVPLAPPAANPAGAVAVAAALGGGDRVRSGDSVAPAASPARGKAGAQGAVEQVQPEKEPLKAETHMCKQV